MLHTRCEINLLNLSTIKNILPMFYCSNPNQASSFDDAFSKSFWFVLVTNAEHMTSSIMIVYSSPKLFCKPLLSNSLELCSWCRDMVLCIFWNFKDAFQIIYKHVLFVGVNGTRYKLMLWLAQFKKTLSNNHMIIC